MKKIILLIVASLMCFSASTFADQPNNKLPDNSRLNKVNGSTRPRTQTPDYIECCYDQGALYFNSESEFDNVTIDIINLESNECVEYNLLSSNCIINIDLDEGIYRIVFISNYATYEGDITIF